MTIIKHSDWIVATAPFSASMDKREPVRMDHPEPGWPGFLCVQMKN